MDNSNIKILLVDDEPDILDFVSYNLQSEGYKVATAASGKAGVAKAREFKPDLILDVMMPEMDGIEACDQIRDYQDLRIQSLLFLQRVGKITVRWQVSKLAQMIT